ncbi:hypothetical protein ACYPKM_04825 [Pseudomonas aeruginosa]
MSEIATEADKNTLYGDGFVLVEAARRIQHLMRKKFQEQRETAQTPQLIESFIFGVSELEFCMETINILSMDLRKATTYEPALNRLIEAESRLGARLARHESSLRETGIFASEELIQQRLSLLTDATTECINLVVELRKETANYKISEQIVKAAN